MTQITVEQVIQQIVPNQPVLNQDKLSAIQLSKPLDSVANLVDAKSGQLSFLASPRYADALQTTNAGVVILHPKQQHLAPTGTLALVVNNPYQAYASVSQLFAVQTSVKTQIHPTAIIAPSAIIGEGVSIGAYSIVGEEVCIGDGCSLAAHVAIEDRVCIGKHCVISSQVVIAHDCQIGDDVRIHAHASIGSEGFGFAPSADTAQAGWTRIAQLGRVIIGNHVRIGSQTCIDRGAIDDTVIADNVIIDNLVQIAHNVTIGAGTAIAAKTGIAGSSHIGKRCIIGGAVGISGHLTITDDVTITGTTLVTKSITQSGSYSSGTVAMPSAEWRRAAVRFRQMGKK
ncbi:UDP-3-O-(3-hydroxymyristoyl)glucosamine N-acyltransferase [Psychrobacter sp. I-STPA6b]|uniref:UDP-3-O-(3-hydroxymyristoyl)glucosamine N-acyltransferase n=1 Tax=Psychrobacter sp. I-STPA6b TaxID=2585718 RepID=UPI001D0C1B57|nr:UDP-3-O-(3-hydroxymyristoyl)glucosamine N-acyltransferase [Psychrobacter sp. I-STPA6b]